MLGNKNKNKKTVMGGVGIALLLCILMALSPMAGLVQNDAPEEVVEFAIADDTSEDEFALPEVYEPVDYEYDETSELEGMRAMNQKAFLTEDGNTALLTSAEPIHYMSDIGSWEEIDLNIKATASGWEVKENIYQVAFAPEAVNGVAVTVHANVDPIITGINPTVMTLDESGTMPVLYMAEPSQQGVSVGGNVLRYSLSEGFELDYSVEETQLKQNLVIRERPVLDDDAAWFGLSEQMRLPVGYGLYLGDDLIHEEITQTQDELTIRNIKTGELLATIPSPIVMEADSTEPYHATYFVQVFGDTVVLSTVVDTDWLMDEDRQFPLALDPSIKVYSGSGGYCYIYYGNCYNGVYHRLYRYYASLYYLPWSKYTFTSANALPTGATVEEVLWKQYMSYSYSQSSNSITAVVMESCGTANRYTYSIPTATCSGLLTNINYGYYTSTSRKMISSIWNSAAAGTYATGTSWKTASLCNSATTCAASGSHNYITSALSNGGSVGMSARYTTSTYHSSYAYASGTTNSYLQVVYSGGTDSTAPTDNFVPYSGITSYKEGARTFFTTITDMSSIDTTTSGAPHLHYAIDNGTYTAVKATTLGTCNSSSTDCKFRATTSSISAGEYVTYFWAYQDLASTPNLGTNPSGGSGSPSTATAPSTTHWFFVDDAANAGNAKKMTITTTDVRAYTTTSTANTFDRQMTYYDSSDEYVFEFDTSECGTGSSSCFYTTSYYFYQQWKMMWTTSPSGGYNGLGGTTSGTIEMHQTDGGYLTLTADNGPGMNLIYLYDSSSNDWAMVGLGTDTGIEDMMTAGTTAPKRTTYGYTAAHLVDIPADFTGTFGKFDFNATYSSSKANWMCVGTNGWYYFFRSTSTNPTCTSGYYYIYSTSYRWSGFAMGSGYYGPQASSGSIIYKVGKVAPEPDTYAPEVDHGGMRDSHSKDRTFTFGISDAGEPPSGLNTTATTGVGPTMYYRVTDADGTVGTWTSKLLSPVTKTRTQCEIAACDWTTDLNDLERSSSIEYYVKATDLSIATTGTNTNTTTTTSFEVGDPNKVFIVEWHDLGYTSNYQCTFQVLMYDVTNEIEFQYDSNCQATYDYATVGYQDQTRTKGATLRESTAYINGANPHKVNYRIGTDSSGHGSETFDVGLTELPSYDTIISGSSNGNPSGYYCISSYYWNQYKSGCNANIDLPEGFTFDYFGTEYNGSDSKNRVHIARMGNMYLKDNGVTSPERSMATWYTNMPELPYSSHSMSKPGNIAPWWGYYSSYYCYDNQAVDCSVRSRVVPFEGKGTDISADITVPTTWNLIDSPIRINPSSASGYLSFSDDLTIEPGVVIQVASGKGLSFDGACGAFEAEGNATHPIVFEGQLGGTWKGLAFTGACSTGTDDRHVMSYVDFSNTTEAAIAAGSRHGASPSSAANVGNFTMDHVTFTSVGSAFEHGSGQGTVLTMTDFEVNDASNSCFDFAENSEVTLRDGEMNDCNSGGNAAGGAVLNVAGSTGGSLIMENLDISDSLVNLINVDLATVWISNVTATSASSQSGIVLAAAGDGTGSSLYAYNFDASGYASGSVNSLDSIKLEDVDLGSANIAMAPGGTSYTLAGPSGSNAIITGLTAGDLTMARMAPSLDDLTIGALSIMGNAPGSDPILGTNWDTEGISVQGCGYYIGVETVSTDAISGSCAASASPNTIVLSDVDVTYTGSLNAIYARNSGITIGDASITMPTTFDYMSKASTNGRIVLIDVDQDGVDCATATDCDITSSSSGTIFFGGLATVKTYKLVGTTKEFKEGHTVQATLVDAGAALFTIGKHKTDVNGETSVWVITENDAGDSFTDHNLQAWGPVGQNETLTTDAWYPGSFGVGDTIELRLEPAPVDLNGTNMDCAFLRLHQEAAFGYDGTVISGGTNTFTWAGKVTMSDNLNIDDCNIVIQNTFAVISDATNSPTLTIGAGGTLMMQSITESTGTLSAFSSNYPLDLDMDGGALTLDGGVIRDVKGGINLDSGSLTVSNSAVIYGGANALSTVATVYVNGGTLDWDDSMIMNSGQTGIGLMFEEIGGSVDNIVVKNAAVGIYSYNAIPDVNGFTLTDNDVGVDVYGGMTLPTIYRSTLLSGQSTGWTTYAIDMSPYLSGGEDYLQVGFNSVYGGGNAHPTYNYATSKYYMIYDRMNIEITDNSNNVWNITGTGMDGYYDGSNGGGYDQVGVPSYHCNNYGYSYTEWYGYSYNKPTGWDWVDTDTTPSIYYPMHYWGYYSPSNYFGGVYAPPEGFIGGYYNICLDYAYTYYNTPGHSARLTMPIVDVSAGNISKVTMYIDVLHNRADNYQDRLEILARVSDDPSDLGNFVRESGTPSFINGAITGAYNGVEVGGSYAAAEFDDITVTSPTNAGLEVTGSVSSSINALTVTGGNYGALIGAAGSGSMEISAADISGTSIAGIYYVKDIGGDFDGTIESNTGAGIKFGSATSKDISWTGMTLESNAIGIASGGSGKLSFTDSTFSNTEDFVISGTSTIEFIEGTVDTASIDVTGSGIFKRMRQLDIQVSADTNAVTGANIVLKNADGEITGTAVTDSNGDANDLLFSTETVDRTGLNILNLAGYEAVTVAKVGAYSYVNPSNNAGDFRYAFDSLMLTDTSGNSHSMVLTNSVDSRICYSFTSTAYVQVQQCTGLNTGLSRTFSSGLVEYGYWGATPRAMNNDVIMVDVGVWYIDGNTDNSLNDSTMLVTGSYKNYDTMVVWSTSPYGANLWSHDSNWMALANDDGEAQGFQIGYNNWNDIVPSFEDSTLTGLAHIVTTLGTSSAANGYGKQADMFNIVNNVITHFRTTGAQNAINAADICLDAGGYNTTITGNTMTGCGVDVMLRRTGFSYYYQQSQWGADDAVIENNTFIGTESLSVWFALNSYSDDVHIKNNDFSGSPNYGIYAQDRTSTGMVIEGNTISGAKNPIYLRGALDWTITNNDITGLGQSSLSGILVKDGYGVIDGNTLVDSDGGILVDGVRYGYAANVTNNDISQTPGRVAPAAVGIWVEDCGSSTVNTGGNTISVMENAIVTDGCDLADSGSTLTAIGGSGGQVWTVQIMEDVYTPGLVNAKEGDTIRWRSNNYSTDTSNPYHNVVSNDTDVGGMPLWSSPAIMNLGSTWTHTFNTAGTYEYHCSNHPTTMYGSIVVTSGSSTGYTSVGVNVVGTGDDITLDGTSISGFTAAIEQYGGDLIIEGGALLSGGAYGVYVEDTDVVIDGAELIALGTTGTALYITGLSSIDATDMDTSGLYGLYTDAVDFRWNGGNSDAGTALMADGGAEGSVENVTWADATTQIDAGSYVTVTSVGNTVTASKLIVDPTAVIHEGNLLDLDITHLGAATSDVGLLIKSTDGAQAAYVSPAYRAPYMNADGDMEEWYGNVLNPSDDAMPGVMSSDDAGEDFLVTWDANNLYLSLTGVDMGTADLQIYIDSSTGGDPTGDSWYVSHALPFAADYVFWAEDGTSGNSGLKVNGFTGWSDVTSSCSGLSSYIGNSLDTDSEIGIPWNCIGEPSSTVRMIVVVQDESTGAVLSVHPDQTITAGATGQTFTEELTLLMGHSDLAEGDDLTNHLLIYRSYVGSSNPSDAKTYDISVKVDADCAEDWDTITSVDMSTNVAESMDILRACPVVTNLVDITVNEDSGTYTLTMTDKADDEQDEESTLTWSVANDPDPSKSPTMLLDSSLSVQTMDITPDYDQFGTYVFHFEVEDSHGLTDSATITFTVINVNDAPIICNDDMKDDLVNPCMPVFADDGAGNLNVIDEGIGGVNKFLGNVANDSTSYVIDMASNDMANEQPQVYTWGAHIKSDDVTVDPYWVQKQYSSVAAMFDEIGIVMTAAGGWDDIAMSGDPSSITPNGTYTLPTLNDVQLLTYLLAQNGCGTVWYQEYMDSSGDKVTAVRSDDGPADCDSTIDTRGKVYSGLSYSNFWMEAYGVDTTSFSEGWDDIFPDGFTTTSGYNPCPAFTVSVSSNELAIDENSANELGGECTIVLTLNDDGGYCENAYLGRTADTKASCVSYTWLVDYPVNHPVYGPIVVTGCYNLYLGLSSFIPQYYPDGTPTGMSSTLCLAYSWVGENTDAQDFEVNFSVTPVNDAPEILDWDRQDGINIVSNAGDVPSFPWKVTLTEDDENVDNLTYDLSAMKHDNDHQDADLVWSIVKAETCDYEDYFSATIVGDEISFDLIKDATTNAPEWEVDYLNNGGTHQKNPLSGEFCPITMYLHDTATAPSYIPNYGMSTANYMQGEDSVTLYVRVDNVAENVPDYFLSTESAQAFDFNGISGIMPKTFVPTTVTIGHGGDEGPYNYAHMLEVTFHSDGYNSADDAGEDYVNLGTQYVTPPAYGQTLEVTDYVYITSSSTRVWVEVDVLTCVTETCDMTASPADRYFGYSFPYAHSCVNSNGEQGEMWSCPGEVGSSSLNADGTSSAITLESKRRPMLEDQNWCNNIMSTDDVGRDCAQPRTFGQLTTVSPQSLPIVVRLIGTADVPSFAPSMIAISAAGLFVSALVLQSRRDEEEESLEDLILEGDEQAVSPVIATILMVAITVVLSGVLYVWASSLADTSAKGVPRFAFSLEYEDGGDSYFHRIVVSQSELELATQAMVVTIQYTDSSGVTVDGAYSLSDTTVYGFYPGNSDSMVTFQDSIDIKSPLKSSFGSGDTIYINATDDQGNLITDIYVSVSYVPNSGDGAVLRTWQGDAAL